MLAQVKGIVVRKGLNKVYVATGPVVLEICVPQALLAKLPDEGHHLTLYVTLRLRGEVLELYGFEDWESKELFEKLISVSRLGPRLALNILGVFSPARFAEVVAQNDLESLSKVPGIGPRRAEKLCVELRAKLGFKPGRTSTLYSEALTALLNLGFAEKEARLALEKVFKEGEDLAEIIKKALKELSGTL